MAKTKKSKNKNKTKKIGFKFLCSAVFCMVFLILFLPTAILLTIGLLPTFVAAIVDRRPGKNKTFTIGAMNFAGCFPYLLELWTKFNSMESALVLLSDPKTIIIMYGAAAIGYLINAIVTVAVSSLLVQKSKLRIQKIEDEKQMLEERWGVKVKGDYILDEYGFPVEDHNKTITS